MLCIDAQTVLLDGVRSLFLNGPKLIVIITLNSNLDGVRFLTGDDIMIKEKRDSRVTILSLSTTVCYC